MRKWWVGVMGVLFGTTASFAAKPHLSADLDQKIRVELSRDQRIELLVQPHPGDAWSRLALRVSGDGAKWKKIAEANGGDERLVKDRKVRVPLALARPSLQRDALRALFPLDRQEADGWVHRVALSANGEGESLWVIAEWFTGDGSNYGAIRRANKGLGLTTRKGDSILIPDSLLIPALRSGRKAPVVATKKPAPVEETREKDRSRSARPSDDAASAVARTAADRQVLEETSAEPSADEPMPAAAVVAADSPATTTTVAAPRLGEAAPSLEYIEENGRRFGVYRLQKGEALYSSVAIRFTGRVYANDVNEVVETIIRENAIADVSRIHVGAPIRIPAELLTAEYLPSNDGRRLAWEKSKRDSTRAARRVEAKDLRGVYVILDAGHGGRDVGTSHDDVWEATYVYDVVCRLRRILESRSGAKVFMTTRSASRGYNVQERNTLDPRTDHIVQTTPEYVLEDAVVGVNLRWYLANSIFRRAIRKSVDPEKVVFISVHADSLHPSLRGAMAYIPGERYVRGSFSKSGKVYLARAEVRESPSVTQGEKEALVAEGLSRGLAESIISSIGEADLPVHPYIPVRDNVVRGGKEWVPAVIRYNKVPTRLLLEMCNLGNAEDRELIQTRQYRQDLARAIYDGLVDFFSSRPEPSAPTPSAVRAAVR